MKDSAKIVQKLKRDIMAQYDKAKNGFNDDPIATMETGQPVRAIDDVVEERQEQVKEKKSKKNML